MLTLLEQRALIRAELLRLCLYYEQHIDDQPDTADDVLHAKLDQKLDEIAERLLVICQGELESEA